MGKPTGFMDDDRQTSFAIEPKDRIRNYKEFHIPLSVERQQSQGGRCMDCGVPYCQSGMMIGGMISGCPLNNLIPEWNDLVYEGHWDQALKRLLKTNNFPEFTGRVCPAPCEAACSCGISTDPVSIKENELGIIENGYDTGLVKASPPKVRTGKKVAVIGSGPAGLAAADQLNKRGHSVTVYERNDRVGGLLMYGIPNMKLEKKYVDRKVALMKAEGIRFVTNADVGKNYKAETLRNEYNSIILACGASKPRDIKVDGRESKGIHFALDFLKSTVKSLMDSGMEGGSYINAAEKNVLVIGGGDTGNDCVGTAIRHGAKSIVQLEMMPKLPDERADNNPWPQWPRVARTDYGQEEAIAIFGQDPRVYETTVKAFQADGKGQVCKAVTVKLKREKDNSTGRIIMKEIPGSEQERDVDMVLIAAGFLGCESYVAKAFGVDVDSRTNVATVPGRYCTKIDGIFTAGDMHIGQSLVVWAIREGRDAAREVDQYLMGYTNL